MASLREEYAEALFALAKDNDVIEDTQKRFAGFVKALDKDIMHFFSHPNITLNEKKDVIKKCVDESIFRDFLFILLDNGRLENVSDIYSVFDDYVMDDLNQKDVRVYVPKQLTDNERKRIKTIMKKTLSASIDIEEIVDTTLKGGLRIEYDGNVWDGTIQNLLKTMQDDLTN